MFNWYMFVVSLIIVMVYDYQKNIKEHTAWYDFGVITLFMTAFFSYIRTGDNVYMYLYTIFGVIILIDMIRLSKKCRS
jgi:hypothetical protein